MAWRTYIGAGAAVIALYAMIPSTAFRNATYLAIGLSSVVALCVGTRLHRPSTRLPWYLFAAGQAAWVLGDVVYVWNLDVRQVDPFPSAADVAYLLAYPLLAAGIWALIRRRGARLDLPGTIDSAIVLVGFGLVSWAWIAQPLASAAGVSVLERTIAVAYPAGDIVLLALLLRLVTAPGTWSTALRLLVGGVALQVVADTAFAAPSSWWQYPGALDVLWLVSYLLWGASALHPQMTCLSQRVDRRGGLTRQGLVALGAAALLPPATFLVGLTSGGSIDLWVVVWGAVVLTSLIVARLACAAGEIRSARDQRDRLQDEVFRRASHDPLTGLFNRAYMLRLIDGTLVRGQASGHATGLVLVDLDRFTAVNDEWGPGVGDAILRETAARITASAGQRHPVGRLGDDQFVVLVESPDAEHVTPDVAGALVTALREPYDHAGRQIAVAARIGLTVSLDAGTDTAALLNEATIANRRARVTPTSTFEVFDATMRQEVSTRAEIEAGLRRALRDGELELYYQPVLALGADVVDGYEALVRWNAGDGVVRTPADFIPVAERSELICEIGRWVLGEATRQFAAWLQADPDRFADLTIAVNISGRHLEDHRIVQDVSSALEASGLPAHHVAIEVTETVLVEVPTAVLQLGALRALGVTISLDDFGTGYTSIGQLRHLPVDTIKIDQSFIADDEPGSAELVALMTAAAHACGMLVVAEGVEHLEQLDVLKDLHCDAAQGFLFAQPLTADAVTSGSDTASGPRLRVVRDS